MQTFSNIFNGEPGSSIRGKLNNALTSIISGSEGINAIWAKIESVTQRINGMDSGISHIVKDISYNPSSLDPYKNAVLIALCTGTFNNIKDKNGTPITIPGSCALTIFYRAANTTYWEYDTQEIFPAVDSYESNDYTKIENSNTHVITHGGTAIKPMTDFNSVYDLDGNNLTKTFERLHAVARGTITVDELDTIFSSGIYLVTLYGESGESDPTSIGILEETCGVNNSFNQRLICSLKDPNTGYSFDSDDKNSRVWTRTYINKQQGTMGPIVGEWSLWECDNTITTDRIEDGAVTSEKIATSAFDDTLSVSGKIAPADVVGENIDELDKRVTGYIDKGTIYNNSNCGYGSRVSVFYPLDGTSKKYKVSVSDITYNGKRITIRLTSSASPYASALVRGIATLSSPTDKYSSFIELTDEELLSAHYIAVIASEDDSDVIFKSSLLVYGDNIQTLSSEIASLQGKKTTYYKNCGTAAATADKTISLDGFVLSREIRIITSFQYTNTADNVTLNINNTGTYPLYFNRMRCGSKNSPSPRSTLDVYFDGSAYHAYEVGGVSNIIWDRNGYIAVNGSFVSDNSYVTSAKIFVEERMYTCNASYISKFNANGEFIERVPSSSTGYIEFDSSVAFICISQFVEKLTDSYFFVYQKDILNAVNGLHSDSLRLLNGQTPATFVDGLPQIKELYFLQGSGYSIVWIRKAFASGDAAPYWGIAFNGGPETERFTTQPNGVIPIYSDVSHTTIIGYVIVDWSKQSAQSVSGSGHEILSVSYDFDNSYGISAYLGIYNVKQGLIPFAKHMSTLVNDNKIAADNSVDLIGRVNKAAISWIDDDFMVNDEVNVAKYNALKTFCENNGIYCDIALIPSNTVGVDTADGSLASKIDAVREWEDIGFRMLYHPVHYGWYNNSWNTQSASEVQRRIVEEIRLFLQNAILLKERILVWPGSSNAFSDNVEIVEKYCDCAISTSVGYNNGVNTGRYQLKRIFPESLLSAGTTKTQIKAKILEAVNSGSWLILGSHIWAWNISDTLDETSLSTANLFDIISYANSLCLIKSTEKCWEERKLMFDWYGK